MLKYVLFATITIVNTSAFAYDYLDSTREMVNQIYENMDRSASAMQQRDMINSKREPTHFEREATKVPKAPKQWNTFGR